MADAFHYMSEKNQFRQDFSFGWQRARVLGAFFNGAFLLALGISILLQSIERFISLKEIEEVKLMLIMGCVGLGLNIITAAFLHEHHHHHSDIIPDPESETSPGAQSPTDLLHQGHAQDECPSKGPFPADDHANHRHTQHTPHPPGRDLGMLGALLHVAGDALNNAGVIMAAAVMWLVPAAARGRFYADPAVGLAIALTVLATAVPLLRRSGEILLQSAPVGVRLGDVKADMESVPGVVSVHELHIWRLDQHKAIASAHVVVSGPGVGADLAGFAVQARIIRECLHAYGIHSVTLQPELLPPASVCPSAADSVSSAAVMGADGGDGSGKGEDTLSLS
ncbi:hypothetical protein CHGG_04627 [Chaetomium globosum CBS 148.51]|uniref:Uncharacterized protein n=1 Tax=Chaetomium globosum (strain ATCC 6205 / CBS 148.51 / DSM 1962 / NBRC 6347 / NRRL 1970) TaxID=306901 RepID=Q2H0R9_CHAGB|nr:uncharacterized protein CHGG_04627 [Chaetomium globosum CBS 148.51]EAQ88008.1 hypothetical protein CHGG_04627 [Chaetomium globosum CBS 148.51]